MNIVVSVEDIVKNLSDIEKLKIAKSMVGKVAIGSRIKDNISKLTPVYEGLTKLLSDWEKEE